MIFVFASLIFFGLIVAGLFAMVTYDWLWGPNKWQ
jgi:hypothetical protein